MICSHSSSVNRTLTGSWFPTEPMSGRLTWCNPKAQTKVTEPFRQIQRWGWKSRCFCGAGEGLDFLEQNQTPVHQCEAPLCYRRTRECSGVSKCSRAWWHPQHCRCNLYGENENEVQQLRIHLPLFTTMRTTPVHNIRNVGDHPSPVIRG